MAPTPLGWLCAVVFRGGRADGGATAEQAVGAAWLLVGFAGLLLQNATFTVIVAIRYALGIAPDAGALWALHDAVLALNGTFPALALVGLTLAGRLGGLVPRWHGVIGVLTAALRFTAATIAPVVTTGRCRSVRSACPVGCCGRSGSPRTA
ncbi:hypothetical protein [Nocardia sp. MW-W600-9]